MLFLGPSKYMGGSQRPKTMEKSGKVSSRTILRRPRKLYQFQSRHSVFSRATSLFRRAVGSNGSFYLFGGNGAEV